MINQELVEYIKSETSKGKTKEEIKQALFGSGWNEADVNEAINSIISAVPSPIASSQVLQDNPKLQTNKNSKIKYVIIAVLVVLLPIVFFVLRSSLKVAKEKAELAKQQDAEQNANSPIKDSLSPSVNSEESTANSSSTSLSQDTKASSKTATMSLLEDKPYLDKVNKFQINPPKGWFANIEEDLKDFTATFSSLGPEVERPTELGGFIMVNAGKIPLGTKLSNFVSQASKSFSKDNGFTLIESKITTLNGLEARMLSYAVSIKNRYGDIIDGNMLQLYIIKNDRAYLVVGSGAPMHDWNEYYKDRVTASLLSFVPN